jgi:hypothetical protein
MNSHLLNIEARVRRLKNAEMAISDAVVIAVILNSLPEKYEPMILAWEAAGTTLCLENVVE